MKKAIVILIAGLLVSGCMNQTAQEALGVNFSQLTKGMSKSEVRSKYYPVLLESDPITGRECSYKYYPEREAAILSSEDNTNHIIFDSLKKSGSCNDDEGIFHSAHKTFASAENAVKNIVKTVAEKKQEEISFTINDKKEQCEAIGFTPATEKFADCVLRLVELDVKTQQSNQIALAESQGNQQVADELRAQRNQQSGAYLMDLGQKLLNPPTRKTTRCTVTGVGSFKTVTSR